MEKILILNNLPVDLWFGWRKCLAWTICLGSVALISILRTKTDVELAFASFGLLPVLAIAWIGGKRNGIIMAFFAAIIWVIADQVTHRQYSVEWIPWVNALTRWSIYSLVAILAAKIRRIFEVTRKYAMHDSLTGLLNRRAFLDIGNSEVARSKRYGHPMAVLFLDLDNFKTLNDLNGHKAGDEALKTTAKVLLNTLRNNDQISRLGGDEFAILLPEINFEEALEAASKISNAINASLSKFQSVSGSIGVAWYREVDRSFSEMLNSADQLMYQVKENSKGGICIDSF